MLSTALVNYSENDIDQSGPGFSTLTRLAGSSWEIWRDIISTNRENIATELEQFSRELEQLAKDVRHNRTDRIRERFEHANILYGKLKENCNS